MIELTRLDGTPVWVPLGAIKCVEFIPDTLVTFLNGDTLLVREDREYLGRCVGICPRAGAAER